MYDTRIKVIISYNGVVRFLAQYKIFLFWEDYTHHVGENPTALAIFDTLDECKKFIDDDIFWYHERNSLTYEYIKYP